jgi:hypothetical protein
MKKTEGRKSRTTVPLRVSCVASYCAGTGTGTQRSTFYISMTFAPTIFIPSVAEPEPQGAASFGRSRIRSRNAMRLRLRRLRLRQWY